MILMESLFGGMLLANAGIVVVVLAKTTLRF